MEHEAWLSILVNNDCQIGLGEAFLVNMQEERVQPARVFDVRLLSFLIT